MCHSIKVFPAANGDCLLIRIKTKDGYKHILIDGGKGVLCHSKLKEEFKYLEEHKQRVDLLVVTHIDDDHIAGIIKLYQDKKINKSIIDRVWFNSGVLISNELSGKTIKNREIPLNPLSKKMSIRQGLTLERTLQESNTWDKKLIITGQQHKLNEINFIILSPDKKTLEELNIKWDSEIDKLNSKKRSRKKMSSNGDYHRTIAELCVEEFNEDKSLFNRSSIAFLLEYGTYKLLMLGDSHPTVIINSLKNMGYSEEKKLKVDVMKISHHASRKNTSNELLNIIECKEFIISSDGSKHGLPNKESLARIVNIMKEPVTFYFNYSSMKNIFSAQECKGKNITCIYLNSNNNYTVGG